MPQVCYKKFTIFPTLPQTTLEVSVKRLLTQRVFIFLFVLLRLHRVRVTGPTVRTVCLVLCVVHVCHA